METSRTEHLSLAELRALLPAEQADAIDRDVDAFVESLGDVSQLTDEQIEALAEAFADGHTRADCTHAVNSDCPHYS